jgi:cell pole-organizing protein PopZ
MPDHGEGQLSDRLAGALNGGANGAALDDDLADILAHDAKEQAPPKPAVARPFGADGERRDLPWLVGRTPEAKEPVPAPPGEAVELSRPQDLRASLPPLFGEATEHAPPPAPVAAEASKAADGGMPKAWSQPPTADEAGKAAGSGILTARTRPSMPLPQALPVDAMGPSEAGEARAAPLGLAQVFDAPSPAPLPTSMGAEAAVAEVAPQVVVGDGNLAVAPPVAAASEVPAAKPAPATALSARTLEQVIAELLEPVIRHWLEDNLPRMVEKVVREEVARAIAAERAAPATKAEA